MILGNTSSQGKYVDPPTSVSATAGNAQATVSFTLPVYDGKETATYVATANPGGATNSGASSPIVVTGLNNGTSYTFTVSTISGYGVSVVSSASNAITPIVPPVTPPVSPPVNPPVDPCFGFDVAANCTASCGGSGSIVNGAGWSLPQFATGGPNELGGACATQGCTGLTMNVYTKSCCPTLYCFIECTGCGPVQAPVGPVGPVGPVDPCAGNTCNFLQEQIYVCTDACGGEGLQLVTTFTPSISGCSCPPMYNPCQVVTLCGTPSNNGEGNAGGNGWAWVTKNTYIPTQGGVCTDTSLYSGSVWYEYSKCGCSNYNLFISCIPAQGNPVQPPVQPPVTPPVVEPVQPPVVEPVQPPVVEPVQPPVDPVQPPVEAVQPPPIDCSACGGGPGLCLTLKGVTGCV